jgi:hypothetical protein
LPRWNTNNQEITREHLISQEQINQVRRDTKENKNKNIHWRERDKKENKNKRERQKGKQK